jgi:glutathione synthase
MIHQPTASAEPILQQVEMNTISAAFSSLGTTVSELHRFMAATFPAGRPPLTAFPVNKSDEGTARMLALAYAQYGVPNAVALFIVLATEGNLFDQRKLQFLLWKNHGIRSIRRTLHQVYTDGQLAAEQRLMLALPEEGESVEVAIAYYRSAYMPDHYQSELEWEARARIELSRAIKCPTLGYQLAGCKKIQQDLALPGVLERFFTADQPDSAHIMAELRSSFAGLYPLDGSELARHITQAALANPDGFVLKPQREGGGNNLYKAQLHEKLQNASDEELAAYILMSKIVPQPVTMSFVRDRRVEQLAGISELGTFAGFLGSPTTIIANETTGFLLRSKSTAFDDGGVAAGVAFLDSPLLTD